MRLWINLLLIVSIYSCSTSKSEQAQTNTATFVELQINYLQKAEKLAFEYQKSQYQDEAIRQDAILNYENAVKLLAPSKSIAYLGLAKLYANTPEPNFDKAYHYIDLSINTNPLQEDSLLFKAQLLARTDGYNSARKFIEDTLSKHKYKKLQQELIFLKLMFSQESIELSNVETLYERTSTYFSLLALYTYLREKNYELARYLAIKSLEFDNTNAIAYMVKSLLALHYKDTFKAFLIAKKGLELDALNIYLLNLYSNILIKLNKPYEALKSITLAYKLAPKDISIINTLAITNSMLENIDKSNELFQSAIKLDVNYPDTYINYGIFMLYTKQDKQSALKYFKQFISKNVLLNKNHRVYKLIKEAEERE